MNTNNIGNVLCQFWAPLMATKALKRLYPVGLTNSCL